MNVKIVQISKELWYILYYFIVLGTEWLSGRVLVWRLRGWEFEPHQRHYVVSLSKIHLSLLVLVQHRKTRPDITEKLLTVRDQI